MVMNDSDWLFMIYVAQLSNDTMFTDILVIGRAVSLDSVASVMSLAFL